MFIGSIRNPMQKFGDGSFFFFFLAPFASLDIRPFTADFLFKLGWPQCEVGLRGFFMWFERPHASPLLLPPLTFFVAEEEDVVV